jgi:hypothetical protein
MSVLAALTLLAGGLHGIVMRGPTAPVCRVGMSCTEPAVGAVLVFSRAGHAAVRVRVGAGGRYSVRLAPGSYSVGERPAAKIGGIRPVGVRVLRGVCRRADFFIDTGIR